MAKTVVVPTAIVKDVVTASVLISGGTAINAANQMQFAYPKEGKLLLRLNNTFAGAKNFTLVAGASSFVASGQGDLVIAMAQNDDRQIIVSSDRFMNSAGQVELSFEASTTGFVLAFYLP